MASKIKKEVIRPRFFEYQIGVSPFLFEMQVNMYGYEYLKYEGDGFVDFIVGDTRYFFPISKDCVSGSHLIRSVKSDFEKFAEKNPNFKPIDRYRSTFMVKSSVKNENIATVDINHAYWRIAFLQGYISETTYKKGLSKNLSKQTYCIALSSQGVDKKYIQMANGKENKKLDVFVKGDKKLKLIYDDIRYRTFFHMDTLSSILDRDFRGYNVDAISFINTPDNLRKVKEYLSINNLLFKIKKP